MKLSLIIPIYKAEEFLPRLFENLEAQDVFFDDKEFGEAIFVNDGSPDNSESIILDYAQKHPWVKYIKQENQGQHIARNTGIMAAKGEYIAFMDQDDAYTTNALKIMIEAADETGAEIVRGKRKLSEETDYSEWRNFINRIPLIERQLTGMDYLIETDGLRWGLTFVWASVYRASFIKGNKLFFETDFKLNEDGVFNWKILPYTKRFILLENLVYLWIQREDSDLHNLSPEHQFKRIAQYNYLSIFYKRCLNSILKLNDSPKRIKEILEFEINWSEFTYLGAMIHRHGLRKGEIHSTILQLKEGGVYPYPHSYPKKLPEGYPSSIKYKIMWRIMSYEWILKMMLRFCSH